MILLEHNLDTKITPPNNTQITRVRDLDDDFLTKEIQLLPHIPTVAFFLTPAAKVFDFFEVRFNKFSKHFISLFSHHHDN